MRRFVLVAALVVLSTRAYADRLAKLPVWNAVAVASTASITSPTLDLRSADFESLVFQAISAAGTADVKIEYAICREDCAKPNLINPTVCTCGSFDDNPDILASSNALSNPEGWHAALGVTVGSSLIKIKVTGNAANNADTVFSADMLIREYSQ